MCLLPGSLPRDVDSVFLAIRTELPERHRRGREDASYPVQRPGGPAEQPVSSYVIGKVWVAWQWYPLLGVLVPLAVGGALSLRHRDVEARRTVDSPRS